MDICKAYNDWLAEPSVHDMDFQQHVLAFLAQILSGQEELRNDLDKFEMVITQSVAFQMNELMEMMEELFQKLEIDVCVLYH